VQLFDGVFFHDNAGHYHYRNESWFAVRPVDARYSCMNIEDLTRFAKPNHGAAIFGMRELVVRAKARLQRREKSVFD
jgi:hypothetical protein